ncbi:Uncharacterized protein OBRU01_02559 [Operophtera brumata]|uniref:MADF domain-containing protein n=1 Tax=Operophtera brumata TaxID=104452 RepID=A0A0L7LS72_OPEBR|nr:Uncharacterized protein OBRU01_02559 [Operophtera brumata]
MDWTNEMVIEFLHVYETEPIIWDLRHVDQKKKGLVAEAWRRVHKKLNWQCSIEDLKKKKDSLMAYYRIHWKRAKKMKMSEEGAEDEYKTRCFTFSLQETRPESDSCELEIQQEIPISEVQEDSGANSKERAYSSTTESATNRKGKRTKECELYGKLLSQKLMRLDEEDRLMLMNQIDNLVFRTTMRAMSQSKSRPPASIPSSSHISAVDLKENYVIQIIKSSPPPESREDPLDS